MYAIVDIAGQQFKVRQGEEIFVHRLEGDEGAQIGFPKVMLIENEGKSIIGTPVILGAEVKVTILEHLRADKIFVFRKKRRKGYQKLNGHRQYLSLVRVDEILEEGGTAPIKPVKAKIKLATPKKAEAKKAAPKKAETIKAEAKKAAPKKTETKKASPVKTESKKAAPVKAEIKKAAPKKKTIAAKTGEKTPKAAAKPRAPKKKTTEE